MADDVRNLLREIRKRTLAQRELISAEPLNKIDIKKHTIVFQSFVMNLKIEMKKSSTEGKYIDTLIKTTEGMELQEIRYVLEKTYDRYDNILELMNKYSDNFDENEFLKYNARYDVLSKLLTFMVENSMGEYKTSDGDV